MTADIEITYSIRGRVSCGRWYARPDRIAIFINVIAEGIDPVEDWDMFMAFVAAVEFHELGHIYGWRGGCSDSAVCAGGGCFWCNMIKKVWEELYYG